MSRLRHRALPFAVSAIAVVASATRAAAAEPDPAAPPPPPGATSTTPPRQKHRFLALPYLGIHSYQNWEKGGYGPGLRLGSLVGARINDRISLNADLTFDIANVDPALADVREYSIAFAFSPLYQLPTGPLEIVFGPKVGIFHVETRRPPGMAAQESRQTGYLLGVNTGVFLPVSAATSIGLLLSYEVRRSSQICWSTTGGEMCLSTGEYPRLVGLSAAVLF